MTSLTARRQQLQTRLKALTERVQGTEAELLSHDDKDWEELATQRESDEVLEHLGLGAQEEMRAIRAALGRLDQGTYGLCQTCGAVIETARLDLLPATPFCKVCAP